MKIHVNSHRTLELFFDNGQPIGLLEMLKQAGNVDRVDHDDGSIHTLETVMVWDSKWEVNPEAKENHSGENALWAVWGFPDYGNVLHAEFSTEAEAEAFAEAMKPMQGLKSIQIENSAECLEKTLKKIPTKVWTTK